MHGPASARRSYIKRYMGAPSGVDVEALKAENEQLKQRVKDLEAQVAEQKVRSAAQRRPVPRRRPPGWRVALTALSRVRMAPHRPRRRSWSKAE